MRLKWWAMTFVATFPSGVTWFYVGFGVSELFPVSYTHLTLPTKA